MGAGRWTDLFIRNLAPKETRYDLREADGFTVRVSPSGAKSFYFVYTLGGTKRRMFLGEYPAKSLKDAHREHADALALVRNRIDPVLKVKEQREAERALKAEEEAKRVEEELNPTIAQLIDQYMEKWAKPTKRTWAEDERQLKKDVVPRLGALKARDVTRAHIRGLLDTVLERGAPVAANRLLAVVQRMFNWAAEKEIVPMSPCLGIKMPSKEVPKDRVLTPDEIRAFWRATDPRPARVKALTATPGGPLQANGYAISNDVRRALKLILVTAQRPGEVVGMEWEEIEGSWWTIPAEKSKNGFSHRVYLSKLALEILGPRREGRVFPSPRKSLGNIHRAALAHALRDNIEAIGVGGFSPHDLRRTAASLMAGAGVNPFTVERVLNHALQGVQQIYNRHSYDPEKKQALETWERKLKRILEEKDGAEVVPLVRKDRRSAKTASRG